MHLKVFLKLKKTLKTSLLGKTQKIPKKTRKLKKKHRAGFFLIKNQGFFQPCSDLRISDHKSKTSYKREEWAVLQIRIRDPVPFWSLDPGSGIGFLPEPGSHTDIFISLVTILLVKYSSILLKLAPIFSFSKSKLT